MAINRSIRRVLVPALVALFGILISFGSFEDFRETEMAGSSARLDKAGQELDRVSTDLQAIALGQVRAIQGLYESSSSVTEEEFDHFVEVVADSLDNQLAYGHRVAGADLDEFLSLNRRTHPNFTITGGNGQTSEVYWPLLHSSETDEVGFALGFDLGSDPVIGLAIETAFAQNRPVASTFVALPGDAEAGDFVLVAPIRADGLPIGVAMVTLQLDELLNDRVDQILGNTAKLTLTDLVGVDEPPVATPTRWAETVEVEGQKVRLVLDTVETSSTTRIAVWLLVLGVGISILAGGLIYDRSRRVAMSRQVATLEEILAVKDRFLASVSHELRTPLTAVVGLAEILASRTSDFGQENGEMIQDIRSSAQQLETLVEDHLTSARLTAGALTIKRDQVDLDAIVGRVVAGADRPQHLTIRIGELGECTGDPIRVRQIVRNLLNNAYRYGISRVEIRATNTIDHTVIDFLNDGPPISSQLVETLFEPFVKGDRPGQPEAIGLGLSVSRKLAQRMGGDLAYSYRDGYVKFSLSLPAAIRPPMRPALARVEPIAG